MKLILVLFAAVTFLLPQSGSSKIYSPDLQESSLSWVGKKVTGEHSGSLKLKSGTLKFAGDQILSATFVIDMNSLAVADIKDKKYNKKLRDHLANDDFFSISDHPTAEFVLKEAKPDKDGQLQAFGDLTIKGEKHPINFPLEVERAGKSVRVKGKATVDRTKYGIKYKSGKFFQNLGDKVIYDNFEVSFNILATP